MSKMNSLQREDGYSFEGNNLSFIVQILLFGVHHNIDTDLRHFGMTTIQLLWEITTLPNFMLYVICCIIQLLVQPYSTGIDFLFLHYIRLQFICLIMILMYGDLISHCSSSEKLIITFFITLNSQLFYLHHSHGGKWSIAHFQQFTYFLDDQLILS